MADYGKPRPQHRLLDVRQVGPVAEQHSLKVFEEGVGLARRCARYLDEAEKRIELLTRDESGALRAEPFDLEEDERS